MIDRKKRPGAPAQSDTSANRLDGADPKELLAVIARANAALPDSDPRKIRPEDVTMLAGNTAEWAARLAAALESMLQTRTPRVVPRPASAPGRRLRQNATTASVNDEYLAHQTREFSAADGSPWCVRIEQGGGKEAAGSGDPPVAVLIFHPANDANAAELSAAEPGGRWDLAAYSTDELRAILARAAGRPGGRL